MSLVLGTADVGSRKDHGRVRPNPLHPTGSLLGGKLEGLGARRSGEAGVDDLLAEGDGGALDSKPDDAVVGMLMAVVGFDGVNLGDAVPGGVGGGGGVGGEPRVEAPGPAAGARERGVAPGSGVYRSGERLKTMMSPLVR